MTENETADRVDRCSTEWASANRRVRVVKGVPSWGKDKVVDALFISGGKGKVADALCLSGTRAR